MDTQNELLFANKFLHASDTQAKALMRIAEVLEDISDILREMNDQQKGGNPLKG